MSIEATHRAAREQDQAIVAEVLERIADWIGSYDTASEWRQADADCDEPAWLVRQIRKMARGERPLPQRLIPKTSAESTLWALQDDEYSTTVFATLEDALRDRLQEEHTTATVRPCEIAFPTIDAEVILDHLHSIDGAGWSDFVFDDCDQPGMEPFCMDGMSEARARVALDELTEALSEAFARVARKHFGFADPDKGDVNVWRFTGPARHFVFYFCTYCDGHGTSYGGNVSCSKCHGTRGEWKELA